MQRIYEQKYGNLNESDCLMLAQLLIKAGYTVRIVRERPSWKTSGPYNYFVEYNDKAVNL